MNWKLTLIAIFAVTMMLSPIAMAADDIVSEESIAITAESSDNMELEEPGMLPTSPFYFVERFTERARLATTFDQTKKIELQMKFAEKRLAEAQKMIEMNNTKQVERTMQRYQEHTEDVNQRMTQLRERNITTEQIEHFLNTTFDKHTSVLRRVKENAPEEAQFGLQTALQNAETNRERIKARIVESSQVSEELGQSTQTEESTGQTGIVPGQPEETGQSETGENDSEATDNQQEQVNPELEDSLEETTGQSNSNQGNQS